LSIRIWFIALPTLVATCALAQDQGPTVGNAPSNTPFGSMFLLDQVLGTFASVDLTHTVPSTGFPVQAGVVKTIKISGNQHISSEAILSTMRTKVGQPFVQATLDTDRSLIDAMGFFAAVDPRARLNDDGSYDITVEVQEFAVVKEIRVTGNKAVTTDEILKAIGIKPGEVFNRRQVQPSSNKIHDLYAKRGLFAEVSDFGPLADSPGTVNLEVIELTVGKVDILGATRTKPRVFRRLIKTKPGQPFSEKKWGDDLRRMLGTGWFDPDSIKPTSTEPQAGIIDLAVDLKEARTGNFGFGLQVDPQSAFAGFLRLSDSNWKGTGQSVGIDLLQSTSGGGPSITFNYANPFIDNQDTTFNVSVYSRLLYRFAGTGFGGSSTPTNDDRYFERRTGFTTGFSRPAKNDDKTFYSVSTRFENVRTSNIGSTSSSDFIRQDGETGALTFSMTRNHRDYDNDPSRGYWLQASVTPGISRITDIGGQAQDSSLLGTNAWTKSLIEYRTYFSPQKARTIETITAPRRVFALRARAGMINGTVPFFEQFFVGGVDSLRGWQDDRFWGRNEFIMNFEYRHPIQRSFNVIGFFDYGGAWGGYATVNSFTQSDKPRFHYGFGPGLSFRTPLGPIRLDLGFNEKGKTRIDFQIGTSF